MYKNKYILVIHNQLRTRLNFRPGSQQRLKRATREINLRNKSEEQWEILIYSDKIVNPDFLKNVWTSEPWKCHIVLVTNVKSTIFSSINELPYIHTQKVDVIAGGGGCLTNIVQCTQYGTMILFRPPFMLVL